MAGDDDLAGRLVAYGGGMELSGEILGEMLRALSELTRLRVFVEAIGGGVDEVVSTTSVGRVPWTWKQLAADQEEHLNRWQGMITFITDLNRCEHGRHRGDVCSFASGCDGYSKGNPLSRSKGDDWSLPRLRYDANGVGGVVLGYNISAEPYVLLDEAQTIRVWNRRRGEFYDVG